MFMLSHQTATSADWLGHQTWGHDPANEENEFAGEINS